MEADIDNLDSLTTEDALHLLCFEEIGVGAAALPCPVAVALFAADPPLQKWILMFSGVSFASYLVPRLSELISVYQVAGGEVETAA